MTVHALAHRDCGGKLRVQEVDVGPWLDSNGELVQSYKYEDRVVCQACEEVVEFEDAYADVDDIEWLYARLLRGDDVTLVDDDPEAWKRKTSDEQRTLDEFKEVGVLGHLLDLLRERVSPSTSESQMNRTLDTKTTDSVGDQE